MEWTEEAIRRNLDGHFYTYKMSDSGIEVVDHQQSGNSGKLPSYRVTGPWSAGEMRLLVKLKEGGASVEAIAQQLGREVKRVRSKWGRRAKWRYTVEMAWDDTTQKPFARRTEILLVDDIVKSVSRLSSIPRTTIESGRRSRLLCESRQIIFWIARKYTGKSFPRLSEILGKDHSTILHGVKKVDENFEYFRPRIDMALCDLGLEFKAREAA
jgi:hypothetical protein